MGTACAIGIETEKGTSVEKLSAVPARRTAAREMGAAEKKGRPGRAGARGSGALASSSGRRIWMKEPGLKLLFQVSFVVGFNY